MCRLQDWICFWICWWSLIFLLSFHQGRWWKYLTTLPLFTLQGWSEWVFYGASRHFKCVTFLLSILSYELFDRGLRSSLSSVSFWIEMIKFVFHFGPQAVIYNVVNLKCSKIRKACKSWDLFLKCIGIFSLHSHLWDSKMSFMFSSILHRWIHRLEALLSLFFCLWFPGYQGKPLTG